MKSKQKLERKTQSVLEDLQPVVSKQQDFFTSSTAPLQETTKLATVGRTPTSLQCAACDVELGEDNWTAYYRNNNIKTCKACNNPDRKYNNPQSNPARMWVNGKYVPKTHPLYKAGRYKGFEDAAFSSLENFKDSPQGQVYIITNPAWEGWVKVGMAVDANDRAGNYQTSSPYRDYELAHVVDTADRRATEAETHARLGGLFEQRNEWFKCSVEMAKRIIDGVVEEQYDEAC